MKNLFLSALVLVGGLSQAASDVAPRISELRVERVARQGEVVSERDFRPFTHFKITVPVTVNAGSACTSFAGQETRMEASHLQVIRMVGASDPLIDACIEILPEPIETRMVVEMKVLTGGIIAANRIQRQVIQVLPLGMFEVTLDMHTQKVTVKALKPTPRD